ncbi:carboxylesterase/lipase family protein [Streptomyces sp. AK04-3B]|uniref:carboxylesterase/lipase family protein n=1 Tax=Streptomyces sp. AK04-3B TaxID=3028650 RepID=UPI0029A8962A|nr:carboxylesterase family protein [Streptomyces sp. AK04-3B]MDX3798655.1 carboxylesterase family protein [Streptomyces sp. AK04-3B]
MAADRTHPAGDAGAGPHPVHASGHDDCPLVSTPYGAVRGRYEHGVVVFRGIPYAAPPFGVRRFRPPTPPEPWNGVRDAGSFGPTPPKPPYSDAFAKYLSDPVVPGDDCLNLNVWTPEPGPGARLPVIVWLHGGALTRGTSATPIYDGRRFAREGTVFVSINYRLGVEGYGLFPDAPANLGLRDQLAALEWVHRSIRAFGGDPDRVTLAGQSAGAISVGALIAAPQTQGLFRRGVLQSGPPEALERDKVRRMVRRMAARLKIPATAEAFAAVDRDLLLRTQAEVGRLSSPVLGGPAFGIVVDGDLVPSDPLSALVDGDVAVGVDLLMGWTRDEYRLWLVPGGLLERVDRLGAVALAGAMARCHCGPEVPRGYRALHPEAGPAELVGQMVTDSLLRLPLRRLADARPGTSYVYEFAWPSRRPGLGACHALELGFVFDTGETPESAKLAGDGAPQELADAMHGTWTRFAATGDPGWEAWNAAHPVRIFGETDGDRGRVEHDRLLSGADAKPPGTDGWAYTAHGVRDRELSLWVTPPLQTALPEEPDHGTPASDPAPAGFSARGTELRSAVRRLRRATGRTRER